MSFFKRNDPAAPAARRAGGTASPSSYERLPADNAPYQSQPSQAPPPSMPSRRPAPPQEDYSAGGGYGNSNRQQPPLPPRAGDGYGQYPSEKAEYRPAQSGGGHRGYGGPAPHGVSTGSGRGV